MSKLLVTLVTFSLVGIAFSTVQGTAACSAQTGAPASFAGCASTAVGDCVLYTTTSGSQVPAATVTSGTGAAGRHCINAATGYVVYTTTALADANAQTDDTICNPSCLPGQCNAAVVATTASCYACNAGYGAPLAATYSTTNASRFAAVQVCTQCNTTAFCGTCFGDSPTKCNTCPTGYYGTGNTTAGVGTTAALTWAAAPTTGPTLCSACNATSALGTGCISCTNNTVCLACNTTGTATVLKNGKCTTFGAKIAVPMILAFVGASFALLV